MTRTMWTVLFATLALATVAGCGDDGDTYTTNNYYTEPAADTAPAETDAGNDAKVDAQLDTLDNDANQDAQPTDDAPQVDSDTDAGQDAQAEAETDAGADAPDAPDAIAHAPILTISYGPAAIQTMEPASGTSGTVYSYTLCTTKLVEITNTALILNTVSQGARTQGSNNTIYFTNVTVKYQGSVVMGPEDLTVLPGETMPRFVGFNEPMQIAAGQC